MWLRSLPRQEPGQPIAAATINRTAEAAEWATRIRASAPLSIAAIGAGPLIRYAAQLFGVYIAVAAGTIAARSGGTPGSGPATIQDIAFSGGAPALVNSSIPNITVYNIGGSTTIAAGKYLIALRIAGFYFVITAEC